MLKVLFSGIFALMMALFSSSAISGIIISGTRIIYSSSQADATISIRNNDSNLPYLVQSWVDPFDSKDKSKPPFTVIPPVSRLEPQQEKVLRVMKIKGSLPQDRESVFWFNVKNIPPASNNPNSMEIAIKTRIKLIWRPETIKETPETAGPKVKWHIENNQLVAQNPSAIHINVMNVTIAGKDIPLNIIRPFETLRLPLPAGATGHELVWRYVNDYGGISKNITVKI